MRTYYVDEVNDRGTCVVERVFWSLILGGEGNCRHININLRAAQRKVMYWPSRWKCHSLIFLLSFLLIQLNN